MGFWSFMRDMFVFDWLFGHRKKESFWQCRQRESKRYTEHSNHDNYGSGNGGYNHNDYVQQDFDDDLDSGMFYDDF